VRQTRARGRKAIIIAFGEVVEEKSNLLRDVGAINVDDQGQIGASVSKILQARE